MAWMADCLLSMHKALGSVPVPHKPGMVAHALTPAFRKCRQEDREFKGILVSMGVFKANLGFMRPCLKRQNKVGVGHLAACVRLQGHCLGNTELVTVLPWP